MEMKDLYATSEARLDTLLGEVSFWAQMQRARLSAEGKENCKTDVATMAWFRDTWGIQLLPSDTRLNGYSQEVKIVDEEKYMIFLLKWA